MWTQCQRALGQDDTRTYLHPADVLAYNDEDDKDNKDYFDELDANSDMGGNAISSDGDLPPVFLFAGAFRPAVPGA